MLAKVLAGGGLGAALAASTCCVLPLSLGAAGLGGAWLSRLSILAPYQTAFRVLAILLLGVAFWMVYGRRTAAVAAAAACAVVPSERITKTALWVGAIMMALVLSSGWWERVLA